MRWRAPGIGCGNLDAATVQVPWRPCTLATACLSPPHRAVRVGGVSGSRASPQSGQAHHSMRGRAPMLLLLALALVATMRGAAAHGALHNSSSNRGSSSSRAARRGRMCRRVRFATFNTSLNRDKAGQLLKELSAAGSISAANISAILQRIAPDVLLLNEFDYEPDLAAVNAFQDNYLSVPQAGGLQGLRYKYAYAAPVNTGVPSGRDFDHDGKASGPDDCFGFGLHPGQYGMVLLSHFPIDPAVRTFQSFLWKDMPGALLPSDPDTGRPWYSEADLAVFRLSSKSHWDVPINIPCSSGTSSSARVHMLLHHPTPPVFDGREKRNMLRNHDEIRLFADYVGGASYMCDDDGVRGGLSPGASFVIMGDHNADPADGASLDHAINQLLHSPAVSAGFVPTSEGGREAGNKPGDSTPPETKTSSFDLRVDYVLPSRDLRVKGGAVWWPVRADPLSQLLEASDHRPVFLDVAVPVSAVAGEQGGGGGASAAV